MRWLRRYWPYVLLVVLLALNVTVVVQRQAIGDWLRLRNYDPPANVVQLANDATMTDHGKHLFYINHPMLEGKEAFNKHCADRDEETAVLGCYHGNRMGIFVYVVNDERLRGVQQVTAAHEMLHQAYDRLSSTERNHLNEVLMAFYESGDLEDEVKEKVDSYRRQDGVVLANEMHSIFGTEVNTLPTELETYYARYFTDRHKVVTYRQAYQGEFNRRKKLVEQYDKQLEDLKSQIDTNKAALEAGLKDLRSKESEISQDISQQNVARYQADVTSYNNQVEAYNAKIADTRRFIQQYNDIVKERNAIAIEEQELQQALDSRLSPAETQ